MIRTVETYPEPWLESKDEAIKSRMKRHRSPAAMANFTTKEETETGRALADWFVMLIDIWVAANLLPDDQNTILTLYFLTEHRCAGSGQLVGRGLRSVECTYCEEYDQATKQWRRTPVSVDRRGLIVDHNRQFGNQDVAKAMRKGITYVKEQKRAAIQTINLYIWPPVQPAA